MWGGGWGGGGGGVRHLDVLEHQDVTSTCRVVCLERKVSIGWIKTNVFYHVKLILVFQRMVETSHSSGL